jgi:hypothetical protein
MFYRLRRTINYVRFHRQIPRLLATPPIQVKDGPLTIVSMVAEYDVRLYLLAIKALYRRLGSGRIVVISDGIKPSSQNLIREHLSRIEFVPVESIDTGRIQRGGTWERLLYCVDRSAAGDFVLQMDSDILCVGPVPEVIESIGANRSFTLAEGIPKKPLDSWVEDAIARKSDNVVHDFERRGPEFPDSGQVLYIRASSGFTGFARNAFNRGIVEDFYDKAGALMGPRWREWGTEQITSNYCIANAPESFGLPRPKYMSWERQTIPDDVSLLHFLGHCRFEAGMLVRYANREIDLMVGDPVEAPQAVSPR